MDADPVCGTSHNKPVFKQSLIIDDKNNIKNTIVYLKNIDFLIESIDLIEKNDEKEYQNYEKLNLVPSFFNLIAASAILLDCLVLPSSEKSQSLAAFLISSAFSLFAFINLASSFAKVVLPAPGNPIIKIIFIIDVLKDDGT